MNWIIIGVLVILAFLFLRIRHIKHKFFLIVLLMILLFFYTTGSRVLSEQTINWQSIAGVEKGLKTYFAWLGGIFGNLKSITANAIKMDWVQKNRTEEAIKVLEEKE